MKRQTGGSAKFIASSRIQPAPCRLLHSMGGRTKRRKSSQVACARARFQPRQTNHSHWCWELPLRANEIKTYNKCLELPWLFQPCARNFDCPRNLNQKNQRRRKKWPQTSSFFSLCLYSDKTGRYMLPVPSLSNKKFKSWQLANGKEKERNRSTRRMLLLLYRVLDRRRTSGCINYCFWWLLRVGLFIYYYYDY